MTPVVGICDYGVGNLRSVERALCVSAAKVVISDDAETLARCDGLVLPGVGAFGMAARALADKGLGDAIRAIAASGKPVLGVCLGYQLLFERSDENAGADGLALLVGAVTRMRPGNGYKVPHMGWNTLTTVAIGSTLMAGTSAGSYMYFVHSYAAAPSPDDVVATTDHGGVFAAAVECRNIMGTQFHPEKSGAAGLRLYANFVSMCSPPIGAELAT